MKHKLIKPIIHQLMHKCAVILTGEMQRCFQWHKMIAFIGVALLHFYNMYSLAWVWITLLPMNIEVNFNTIIITNYIYLMDIYVYICLVKKYTFVLYSSDINGEYKSYESYSFVNVQRLTYKHILC